MKNKLNIKDFLMSIYMIYITNSKKIMLIFSLEWQYTP